MGGRGAGEGISQGRMQSANACRLNVTKNEQGGIIFFYDQDLHVSLTYLASRRSGVDPHLASRVAIIDLKLLDLHEVRWTNDNRTSRVAKIKWRTYK